MKFKPTDVDGAFVVSLDSFVDNRGSFARIYCEREFGEAGAEPRVSQMNFSYNKAAGTLRGLHFQRQPFREAKTVRVVRGALWDVIVDLRAGSPTFGRWTAATLSAENKLALHAPAGTAHGFITLEPDTEAVYMASAPYTPSHDSGLRWDDPEIGIEWPMTPVVISEKDASLPGFAEAARIAALPAE